MNDLEWQGFGLGSGRYRCGDLQVNHIVKMYGVTGSCRAIIQLYVPFPDQALDPGPGVVWQYGREVVIEPCAFVFLGDFKTHRVCRYVVCAGVPLSWRRPR